MKLKGRRQSSNVDAGRTFAQAAKRATDKRLGYANRESGKGDRLQRPLKGIDLSGVEKAAKKIKTESARKRMKKPLLNRQRTRWS